MTNLTKFAESIAPLILNDLKPTNLLYGIRFSASFPVNQKASTSSLDFKLLQ